MDGTDGAVGRGAEHQACSPARKLCSCGSFEKGTLVFHLPGRPGHHPGCAKCRQAANPDSGCPCRAAPAKLEKLSDLLRVQHLNIFTCYLRQVSNFPFKLLFIWVLRCWWWGTICIMDMSTYTAHPVVQLPCVPSHCQEQKAKCATCDELIPLWWEEKLCCEI